MDNQKVASKVAIITGGSGGIGKAIAQKLMSKNYKVIIADIKPPDKNLENIEFIHCDITSQKDIKELYNWTVENKAAPTLLVLCAGIGVHEKLSEGDPEKWQKVMDTNVMGALRVIRAFIPEMLAAKNGQVVFISSVSANNAYSYGGVYSASKSALEVLAETLRVETVPHIRVIVISPGAVNTNFFRNELSGSRTIESFGTAFITATELADVVYYSIDVPQEMVINKIITRPVNQLF